MCFVWFLICLVYVPKHKIPLVIKPYAKVFEDESKQKIKSEINIVNFDKDDESSIAGLCRFLPSYNIIEINENYWNRIGNYGKEQLLLHELGHCELGYDHNSKMLDNRPESIMYPVAFGDDIWYAKYRNEYFIEFFHRKEVKSAERINNTVIIDLIPK